MTAIIFERGMFIMKRKTGNIGAALLLTAVMLVVPLFAGGGAEKVVNDTQHSYEVMEKNEENYFLILNIDSGEVEKISAFDYICGTVAAEMPASYHEEALKAQAVAAYTYADRQRIVERANPSADMKGADLTTDSAKNQAFLTIEQMQERWGRNFGENYDKICKAVSEVEGLRILYNGEPILAAYHALSSGKTQSSANVWGGELAYLASVDSVGDESAEGFETTVKFAPDKLKEKILAQFPNTTFDGEEKDWINNIERTDSGMVKSVTVGSQKMSGTSMRYCLGLRSACFDVSFSDGVFVFTVKGYGHGVGLSQTGANYMANNGAKFDEILKHYYTGVEIK